MTSTVKARHRKAARPLTPLSDVAPAARRGFAVAASSGLALTMIASGASAAGEDTKIAESAGALNEAGVAALATDAREVVTTNAAISTGAAAEWGADVVEVATATAEAPVEPEPEADTTAEAAADEVTDEIAATTTTESTSDTTTTATSTGAGMVALAMQYVGTPYVWGASGPSAFDCSGLVSYVYAQYGISIPHQSSQIRAIGTQISAAEAQPGDIVWWSGHVGLYAGDGMMVDASPGTGVSYQAVYSGATYLRVY
ncbi:C40 family peptidase [Actinomyces sp. MRS3W]|uniref:C40 family peptidase n=1 Tax=Actinomyces sp. MRS3W TaxID=2800796 RepID=UPI0028FD83D8|nr:C40 family peptidase [Actinomyces sp. MRS3W]MDU0348191.1 C40 family peptidase [Actinomyces sp. MRS3W]